MVNPVFYPAGAQLTLTFPGEIGFMENGLLIYSNVTNAASESQVVAASHSGQVLTLPGFTSSAGSSSFHFFVRNALNPRTVTTTSTFTVLLSDSSGHAIASSTSATVTPTPKPITSATLEAVNPAVGAQSSFNIIFTPSVAPPSDARIVIILPADLTLNSGGTTACFTF